MRIKLTIVGFLLTIVGLASTSIARNVGHERADAQINRMPMQRLSASIISPEDVDGLIAASDLIVIGKIQQSIEEAKPMILRDADGEISSATSEVQFKVQRVFKGDLNLRDREITVGQQAAILIDSNGKPYVRTIEDFQPFKKNSRYLLFLKKGFNTEAYFPTGVYFGKYNIDGTDNSEDAIQTESFQSMRKIVKERFKEN